MSPYVAPYKTFYQDNKEQIRNLLLGRKVTKVAPDGLVLDNGLLLRLGGNEGGCACDAGCYSLTELNGTDNVITNVEFVDAPGDDEYPYGDGEYRIFVYARNDKVNLATFKGTDGNGYYGTGYWIEVHS